MHSFESEKSTVGDFFDKKDTVYRVPSYQREYSWGDEHVTNLLEDLLSGESYFFGTFVFNKEYYNKNKIIDIVDGQQRILTITIVFSVIRDLFFQHKDREKSNQIQSNYISNKDDDGNDNFKVIASKSARIFFENNIQKESAKIEESSPLSKEEKLIKNNYNQIKEVIQKKLNAFDDNKSKIEYIRNVREGIKRLELIIITVESEEDAFNFFETLNARGMELSQADLIKNLIFKKIAKDNNEIEGEWKKIKEFLTIDESADLTQFIRHFWLSTQKKITEKKLFNAIKRSEMDYEELLTTLVKEAELYRMILAPNSDDWDNENLLVFKALKRISKLNVRQSRSILLTLIRLIRDHGFWEKNKSKKFIETFELIEKFTFSFSTVAEKSPSSLENIYSKYSIKLNNEYLNRSKYTKANCEKILKLFKEELVKIFPEKGEFVSNFSKIEYSASKKQIKLLGYILERINYNGNSEEIFDHITLEHILPQNPNDEWHLDKDKIAPFVNMIGNIIPLGAEYNIKASNSIIEKKIKMYEESGIVMTNGIIKTLEDKGYVWGESDIRARTDYLANQAYEIWNIK